MIKDASIVSYNNAIMSSHTKLPNGSSQAELAYNYNVDTKENNDTEENIMRSQN